MLVSGLKLLSRLPLPVLYGLAPLLRAGVYRFAPSRRTIVVDNLRRAFPEHEAAADSLIRQTYRNYADVAVEMLKSLTMKPADLTQRVRIEGTDLIDRCLGRGEAVLVTMAHQCNIEWLLLTLCLQFEHPVEAIYRPLSDPRLEALMSSIYVRFGGTLIDDRNVVKEVMRRRAVPRLVAIAADQAPNWHDETYWTEFLNQDTGFYYAPETLARFANFPVVFIGMQRIERGRYQARVQLLGEPPYRESGHALLDRYIRAVETQIRAHPSDWFWFHNRWKRKRSLYG